eukprot:COSAG06_NODE_7201_length_2587_cov_1.211013_2_plen_358_part_00
MLDATLELNGDTAMVSLHENAFATGYLRRWIDYVSYLIGLATSFGVTTEEKLTHAFGVLCELDEEAEGDREGTSLHLGEFIALIDSTQGLTGEHDEAAVNQLFRTLAGDDDDDDDDGEDEDGGAGGGEEGEEVLVEDSERMTAEQFLAAAQTTPQLLRYFASIGLMVASLQTGDAATESSAFAADMDARAVRCSTTAAAAATPDGEEGGDGDDGAGTDSLPEATPPGEGTGDDLGMVPEGLGGGRPGKEHGARSASPPALREEKLFELRRAFALYDTGDGTVARADGWRLLQTMGEEEHTPEDFERLLMPSRSETPAGGTVRRVLADLDTCLRSIRSGVCSVLASRNEGLGANLGRS